MVCILWVELQWQPPYLSVGFQLDDKLSTYLALLKGVQPELDGGQQLGPEHLTHSILAACHQGALLLSAARGRVQQYR
jgi:organic hydroperoxide reductase OsmC/OhrA